MTCTKCGKCGKDFGPPPKPDPRYCVQCGAENDPGSTVCAGCGAKLPPLPGMTSFEAPEGDGSASEAGKGGNDDAPNGNHGGGYFHSIIH